MYRAGHRQKSKRRRVIFWLIISFFILLLIIFSIILIRRWLRPVTTIKQSAGVTTKANFDTATTTYTEPDFTIALPTTWTLLPRPVGPYHSYTWQSSDRVTDGQLIEIYEDVIPVNFAVNRELDINGDVDHLTLDGVASDNCVTFTRKGVTAISQTGVAAKWQGISFLCDQYNTENDVIGTSSSDGVNTVILKTSTGASHKFFFTYTDYNISPDYSVFYSALNSFAMR